MNIILQLLTLLHVYNSKVVEVKLTLSYAKISPDGYEKAAVVVNNQLPGPPIRVKVGDTCVVHVKNDLFYEGASIHFHGLYQNGSNEYDGVAYGTQWPIMPSHTFTYRFQILNRPGTYFYHAHYQLQSQAVYGAFIIEDPEPPFVYHDEKILLLSDWYHESDVEQLAGLMSPVFKWIGDPQSILINGKGRFNCSIDPVSTCNLTNIKYEQSTIEQGKTYRLRFIGTTSLSYFKVTLQGHSMKIIEADGIYVEPYVVESLEINSGERYSVLITADQPIDNYLMKVEIRWRKIGVTGVSVFSYVGAPFVDLAPAGTGELLPYFPETVSGNPGSMPNWELSSLRPIRDQRYYDWVPKKANKQFLLVGKQSAVKHPKISNATLLKWTINDLQLNAHFKTPLLLSAQKPSAEFWNDIPKESHGLILEINSGDVVDVILQNTVALNGVCEQHPWHLHGHHFWVIGSGPGQHTEDSHRLYNLENPIIKDSITVYPYDFAYFQTVDPVNHGKYCGWRVVRFKANNPGVWNMHCHIVAHMHMGMQVFFLEAGDLVRKFGIRQNIGMGQ